MPITYRLEGISHRNANDRNACFAGKIKPQVHFSAQEKFRSESHRRVTQIYYAGFQCNRGGAKLKLTPTGALI